MTSGGLLLAPGHFMVLDNLAPIAICETQADIVLRPLSLLLQD